MKIDYNTCQNFAGGIYKVNQIDGRSNTGKQKLYSSRFLTFYPSQRHHKPEVTWGAGGILLVALAFSFSIYFLCSSADNLATRSRSTRSLSAFFFCANSCCEGVSSNAARLFVNRATASARFVFTFLDTSYQRTRLGRATSGRNLILERVSTT